MLRINGSNHVEIWLKWRSRFLQGSVVT